MFTKYLAQFVAVGFCATLAAFAEPSRPNILVIYHGNPHAVAATGAFGG
jgi:hypothetical protein